MKLMRVVVAACAVLAVTASVARADLVLVGGTPALSFTDLGAQGFGNAPRLLTLQTNGVESGSLAPNIADISSPIITGDAIDNPGDKKATTPTLSALGWTSGAAVGIGFNSNQTGGPSAAITMQDLVLTIYNLAGVAVNSFALGPAFINFTAADLALQQGNGNSVFNFGLDAAQQLEFNATIIALAGSSGFYAGLGSTLGCPAGSPAGCLPSNDGADSFVGFAQAGSVPDGGSTATLLGSALVAFGMLRRRLRS